MCWVVGDARLREGKYSRTPKACYAKRSTELFCPCDSRWFRKSTAEMKKTASTKPAAAKPAAKTAAKPAATTSKAAATKAAKVYARHTHKK